MLVLKGSSHILPNIHLNLTFTSFFMAKLEKQISNRKISHTGLFRFLEFSQA